MTKKFKIIDFDGPFAYGSHHPIPSFILEGLVGPECLANLPEFLTFDSSDWITILRTRFGITEREKLVLFSHRKFEYDKNGIKCFSWVEKILPQLKEKNDGLAIATSNSIHTVMHALRGMHHYFQLIETWETTLQLKPSPECLLKIGQEFGAEKNELIQITDGLTDVIAGAAMGIDSWLFHGEWTEAWEKDILKGVKEKKLEHFIAGVKRKPEELLDI